MFVGKYLDWNQKRIKGIVDFYGHQFFFHKKILDLGCGHADISGVLYRLGGNITAVDARQEHLQVASRKYPGIKTVKADLDRGWAFYGQAFDLILDLDILCHINNYEEHLKAVCASTTFLVLETAVCDSPDPYKCIPVPENKNIFDAAVNGIGARPTSAAIERVLQECGMNFRRQDYNKYNSGSYTYDWQPRNNDSIESNKRRIWYCVRNTSPQQFPNVTPALPTPPPASLGYISTLNDTKIPVSQSYVLNPRKEIKTEKKLKTALCISGHLRTFEDNYESVKVNILEKLDCDVFIHTWDSMGLSYRFTDAELYKIETQKLIDRIQNLYKPKKLVVEPTKEFRSTPLMQARLIDHRDIPGILSMFYKIEVCNNLKKEYEKENKFIYDCVIRFRGDLFMELPLPLDHNTNLNFLFVPMYGNFGGLCDQFAYGSSAIMDTYSSLYSNIQRYMESGCPMNPEKMVKFHIEANRIPVTKVNVRFLIKRANGLVQDNMLLERALGFVR